MKTNRQRDFDGADPKYEINPDSQISPEQADNIIIRKTDRRHRRRRVEFGSVIYPRVKPVLY